MSKCLDCGQEIGTAGTNLKCEVCEINRRNKPIEIQGWICPELPESNVKYIVTPNQIAKIVEYCLNITVHGNQGKNWISNVLTAIDGINKTGYGIDKIKLELADFHKET